MNYESKIKNKEATWTSSFQVKKHLETRCPSSNKGFSLFELLVVISIAAVVAAVSFSTFPKMNSKLSLDLLAQDIALTLREAQVYGTTVLGGGVEISNAYGVSFPDPADAGAKSLDGKYRYTIFADMSPLDTNNLLNRQGYYNEGKQICMDDMSTCASKLNSEPNFKCGAPAIISSVQGERECLKPFLVGGRDEVAYICLNYINNNTVNLSKDEKVALCKDGTGFIRRPEPKATVDIVYRRPRLQASISTRLGGLNYNSGQCDKNYCGDFSPLENVGIVVSSESGETRVVIAWGNGQISIDK